MNRNFDVVTHSMITTLRSEKESGIQEVRQVDSVGMISSYYH